MADTWYILDLVFRPGFLIGVRVVELLVVPGIWPHPVMYGENPFHVGSTEFSQDRYTSNRESGWS